MSERAGPSSHDVSSGAAQPATNAGQISMPIEHVGPPACTAGGAPNPEDLAQQIRLALDEVHSLRANIRAWQKRHHHERGAASLDATTLSEAEHFYDEATRCNRRLRELQETAQSGGLELEVAMTARVTAALRELQVVLAFPPLTLQEARQRVRAGKWRTLADAEHELGYSDR